MVHIVDICGIHFSQSLLGIGGYGDNGGYWDLGGIVSIGENAQGDEVASINIVGILFIVVEGKDRAAVGFEEWSGCHPKIYDTEVSFGHSDVWIQRKMEGS